MDVIAFGSAIVDFISYVPRLPTAGETIHGHRFTTGFGGKGANQCVAARKLGANAAMIAKLGDDKWGKDYMQNFKKVGVNVDFVEECIGETTGIAQISVSDAGENHIVIVAGANNLLSKNDINTAASLFNNSKILICQLETPIEATICALRKFHGRSILNAAPAMENIPPELLKEPSIFCVNENEATLITGVPIANVSDSKAALTSLIAMGANLVVITLGELGAVYVTKSDPQNMIHVPTRKIKKVVDTTGAGDAFIGSLAYYLANYPDLPMHQQIGAACEVASYSVQHFGTQASFPYSDQISIDFSKRQFDWVLL